MLHTTPQERLALGVVSLLLAAGAGARWLAADRSPAAWVETRGAAADTPITGPDAPPLAEAEREAERERIRATPLAPGERIDPNRASLEELERLPRVGPALAARIAAGRPFRSLAELEEVPGIGPALLRSLEPHLSLPSGGAGPLDLNRATAAELEALPGVGEVLARRIVEWRRLHGPFRSVEELEEVPGVGPALRARLAPLVRAGG